MIKRISALLVATVLTIPVAAEDTRAFGKTNTVALIGLELGSMNMDAQNDFGQSYSESGIFDFGIRLGAKTEDYRFMGAFHVLDNYNAPNGDTVKNTLVTAHLDYMFWRWDVGSNMDLKPFIGANVGYQEYKTGSIDEDGVTYGAETGLILDMGIVDADLGIRYMGSQADHVNDMFNVYLGVNLKIQP